MVVGIATTKTMEPASGRTVKKEGGEGPEKTPISRTLAPRKMGGESRFHHPPPYTYTYKESAKKIMVRAAATAPAPPPNSEG